MTVMERLLAALRDDDRIGDILWALDRVFTYVLAQAPEHDRQRLAQNLRDHTATILADANKWAARRSERPPVHH
jgi:hypothetical protein